jgi:hypothetical protein
MSVDYELACHKHREKVDLCSDGFSGPLTQCDNSMAAFAITHKGCDLNIIDEHSEDCDDYKEWHKNNWRELLSYN